MYILFKKTIFPYGLFEKDVYNLVMLRYLEAV